MADWSIYYWDFMKKGGYDTIHLMKNLEMMPDMKNCPTCGKKLSARTRICPSCNQEPVEPFHFLNLSKSQWIILAASALLLVIALFNWAKMVAVAAHSSSDLNLRANMFTLSPQLNDINQMLRYLSIEIKEMPLIKAIAFTAMIFYVLSFGLLLLSFLFKKTEIRTKLACWGFGAISFLSAAFMVATPIANDQVKIASKEIITSIVDLTIFPFLSFAVAALAFLYTFAMQRSNKEIPKMTTRKLVASGVLTAIVLLMTSIVKIPVPATGGYVHPGDGAILFSALLLGPYAAIIGGIGSALSDLLGGYFIYILPTFIIKAAMGCLAGYLVRDGKTLRNTIVFALAAALMVFGYYIAEGLMMSFEAALAAVVPNLMQGAAAVVIGIGLSFSAPSLKKYLSSL